MSLSPNRPDSITEMEIEKHHISRESPIIPKVEIPDMDLYTDQGKPEAQKIDDDDDVGILDFADISEEDSMHQQLFGLRRQRKFILESDKDDLYWDRRKRNNEAAKRSREKRRVNDMILESRVSELSKQNNVLRAQLDAMYIRDQRSGPMPCGNGFTFNGNANGFYQPPQQFFQNNRFPYFPSNVQYSSPLPQIKQERDSFYDTMSRRNSFGQQTSYGDVPNSYGNNNYIAPHFPKLVMNNQLSNMGQNLPLNPLSFQANSGYSVPPLKTSRKRLNSDPTSEAIPNPPQHSPTLTNNREILVASRHRHYSTAGHSSGSLSPVSSNASFSATSTFQQSSLAHPLRSSMDFPTTSSIGTSSLTMSPPTGSNLFSSIPQPNNVSRVREPETSSKLSSFNRSLFERRERSLSFSFPSNKELIVNQSYSETRPNLRPKTSTIENVGEKRKQFIINDMLEESKAYPQDLDTALNLSHPEGSTETSDDLVVKDDEAENGISSPKSLRRVPSITSEDSNRDPSQNKAFMSRNSSSGCPSPAQSNHSSTSDNSGSSDVSTPKGFASNSLNETFIPYKFRFKSGLYDDSQNSFGFSNKT